MTTIYKMDFKNENLLIDGKIFLKQNFIAFGCGFLKIRGMSDFYCWDEHSSLSDVLYYNNLYKCIKIYLLCLGRDMNHRKHAFTIQKVASFEPFRNAINIRLTIVSPNTFTDGVVINEKTYRI